MGRLHKWLNVFLTRADPGPVEPGLYVQYRLQRMNAVDRTAAIALRDLATGEFSSPEHADRWLANPVPFLGDRRPIDIMHSAKGRAAVEHTLWNMRYGIYS